MRNGDILPGLGELAQLGEQRSLLDAAPVSHHVVGEVTNPVARVHIEMPQPHMDRVFDYLVPAKLDEEACVGARVMVDVGQRQVPGFIIERDSRTETGGKLRVLRRVVSPMPVLSPEIYKLCQRIAARQASSVSDVLRLAIPQRHARAEKEFVEREYLEEKRPSAPEPGLWGAYRGGPAFVSRLSSVRVHGQSVRRYLVGAEASVYWRRRPKPHFPPGSRFFSWHLRRVMPPGSRFVYVS